MTADNDYHQKDLEHPAPTEPMSDQRRAFLEYKKRVHESGKPFFPYGVYHDVIAATAVLAFLVVMSVMWFGMANCDSPWNVTCDRVSTPLEQEHYTPDDPGTVVKNDKGEVDHDVEPPLLGLLYEEKADPATTSYHPRPEWYFYFLFYLLIIFSNPQLVFLGTIVVPTIWLVMLIAWPFVDRKKERRPSRRPIAMAAMVLTAVTLLAFTYKGSQSGKEESGGPEGMSDAQIAMPGYQVLFEEGTFETCGACHQLGGLGGGNVGPDLTDVGTRYDSADDLTEVMANGLGGGAMPVKGGAPLTDEQAAQVAAFLKTLGVPDEAETLSTYGLEDWERVTGAGGESQGTDTEAADDAADPASTDEAAQGTTEEPADAGSDG